MLQAVAVRKVAKLAVATGGNCSNTILSNSPIKLNILLLCLAFWGLYGCSYRFTNKAMRPPNGIKKIAIEAIYDTSWEVLPHEILWEALGRAFAKNGHLLLTSSKDADGLLRAQIVKASINPTGEVNENKDETRRDPKVTRDNKPSYRLFNNLMRSGRYTEKENITLWVKVELWDLKTKKMIFTKKYQGVGSFKSHYANVFNINTHYLLFEEALKNRFKTISKDISNRIVIDILL